MEGPVRRSTSGLQSSSRLDDDKVRAGRRDGVEHRAPDVLGRRRVEHRRRLVQEQQAWTQGNAAGQRQALALAPERCPVGWPSSYREARLPQGTR